MRGVWVLGVLIIVGACGADGTVSGTASTSAPLVTTSSTTAGPVMAAPVTSAPTTAPSTTVSATTTVLPTTSPAPNIGPDGVWEVTSGIVNGEPVPLIDGAPITLTAEGSKLSGSASCNSYEFTIELRAVGVEIVDDFVTEIGCESPIAELEALYLQSFGPTATYLIDGSTLTWQTPTATWIFDRVPPVPAAPLVGITWVLNGVIDEFVAMSAAGIEEGRIVFAAEGTFAGSTSCRDFMGTWVLVGATINAVDVVIAGECTGPMAEIDEIVVRVFDEGLVASIDGDRLSARPSDNLGLDYFAEA
jgi:heat shock protein HslJ